VTTACLSLCPWALRNLVRIRDGNRPVAKPGLGFVQVLACPQEGWEHVREGFQGVSYITLSPENQLTFER